MKNLSITDFIKTDYKDYALYTLHSRGIPSFYDSLTPVQRIILMNAPLKFDKTLKTVGNCISDGYHHGNVSCEKSCARMARNYDFSKQLLDGDGFFGNKINQEAAASRYTSIRLNKEISDLISEYSFLNQKINDEEYKPLNLRIPIGLGLPIIGIAVGYRTLILPRKFKDIEDFLSDKRSSLTPYFKDFKGKIFKLKELENSWLFEGEYEIDEIKKTIHIKSLPPLMKYDSFIKKLNKILENCEFEIENLSKDEIDLKIKIKFGWTEYINKIIKQTKMIIRESIILIKDKKVLEYSCIEDYLLDFKNQGIIIEKNKKTYILNEEKFELDYNEAKKLFFEFMMGHKRTEQEVKDFISPYNERIQKRLENIKAQNLNKDRYISIISKIKEVKISIAEKEKDLNKHIEFISNTDFSLHNKKSKIKNLFENEDVSIIDDIEVFNPFVEEKIEEEVE